MNSRRLRCAFRLLRNASNGPDFAFSSGSAEEFAVTIKNDHDSWGPIIRNSGVRLDQ